MSKNTGTSELINYFDLGANGDVGIAGSLDINTILQATTDTDKFLVSDTGIIKYRTGAELLADIGGQAAGNFVTLNTIQTITAQKTFSTSGSSDTMLISHGSGSGIALNISKAGNGEGLRVAKTSGSGNAVTITGGLLSAEAATLTGALNGTSAVFSGGVTINGLTFVNNTSDTTARLLLRNTTTGADAGGLDIREIGVDASINNASNGSLSLLTNNTNRLTISSTGAATFSSSAALQTIFDSTNASGGFVNFRRSGTSIGYLGNSAQLGQGILNALELRADNNLFLTTISGLLTMTSGGNVGIGTSSINASSGYKMLRINGATTGGEIVLAGNEVEHAYVYASSGIFVIDALASKPMRFRTGAQNRIDITSSGNVLIGTTTDNGDRMNISGAVSISSNLGVGRGSESGVRLSISGEGTSSDGFGIITRDSLGNDLFYVRNDGYMNTGSRASSPYNLTSGNAANMVVGADGTLYRSTSSLKYKTDVKDYDKGLAEVLRMRSVYYKGKNDGDTQFAGLIAEEIHELGLTEFVQYAQDGTPDALAYSNMVALLVKAIQEQQEQIDKLKNS